MTTGKRFFILVFVFFVLSLGAQVGAQEETPEPGFDLWEWACANDMDVIGVLTFVDYSFWPNTGTYVPGNGEFIFLFKNGLPGIQGVRLGPLVLYLTPYHQLMDIPTYVGWLEEQGLLQLGAPKLTSVIRCS